MVVYLIRRGPGEYLNNKWGSFGPFTGSTLMFVKHAAAVKRCNDVNDYYTQGRRDFAVAPFALKPVELMEE
jgi:hypothetical protein